MKVSDFPLRKMDEIRAVAAAMQPRNLNQNEPMLNWLGVERREQSEGVRSRLLACSSIIPAQTKTSS
jgi:hypothetical protein